MPIVAFSSLLYENKKKSSDKMCKQNPGPKISSPACSPYPNWALATWEIFKLLFMRYLIFGL